jgi:hypothetical protein
MKHNWQRANGNDIADIIQLSDTHFRTEADTIFIPDKVAGSRNLTFAIVNQFYTPSNEILAICRDAEGKLLAYTWAKNNQVTPWSDEKMIVVQMAHLALDLNTRKRVELLTDMLEIWEQFAKDCKTPIICSTTMRREQSAFLKLHAKYGYDVRGSYAYKRIDLEKTTL